MDHPEKSPDQNAANIETELSKFEEMPPLEASKPETKSATIKMPHALTNRGGYQVILFDPQDSALGSGGFSAVLDGIVDKPFQIPAEHVVRGEEPPSIFSITHEGGIDECVEISSSSKMKMVYEWAEEQEQKYKELKNTDPEKARLILERTFKEQDRVLLNNPHVAVKFHKKHTTKVKSKLENYAEEVTNRKYKEYRIHRQLVHPHIVACYAQIQDPEWGEGLVMESVKGKTLHQRMVEREAEEHRMPIDEAVGITLAIARACQYMHAKKFIHRDLKPANIMIRDADNSPVIIDFGGSRDEEHPATQEGMIIGTAGYMAPEQVRDSSSTDERTDTFALGLIFYEMLTGKPLYVSTVKEFLKEIDNPRHPHRIREYLSNVSTNIEHLLNAMLAKDPEDRPKNDDEFNELIPALEEIDANKIYEETAHRKIGSTEIKERLIDTRKHVWLKAEGIALEAKLKSSGIDEEFDLIERLVNSGEYETAGQKMLRVYDKLNKEALNYEPLLKRKKDLEGKISVGNKQIKARALLQQASAHKEALDYLACNDTLAAIEVLLKDVPKMEAEDVHDGYKALNKEFSERPFVQTFDGFRKSFVVKVAQDYKEIIEKPFTLPFEKRTTPPPTAAEDLLELVTSAETQIATYDATKIGNDYERTREELKKWRAALENSKQYVPLIKKLNELRGAYRTQTINKDQARIAELLKSVENVEASIPADADKQFQLYLHTTSYINELRQKLEKIPKKQS